VRCDVFITESTFGLPIYRWRPDAELFANRLPWWAAAAVSRASVLLCYSFGKAQRLLSGVDASIAPIIVHSAVVQTLNQAYRRRHLPGNQLVTEVTDVELQTCAVVYPPGADGSVGQTLW
jgi:putative mRNA 3-end processing factor